MPKFWRTFEPLVPWDCLESSDCKEANDGELELYRDTHVNGQAQRQIGMMAVGQFDHSLVLGLVAIRCERRGDQLIPLTLSIPETPAAIVAEARR